MTKVILIGSPQTQWNIGERFLPGNTLVDLTETEIKKHKDVIQETVGKTVKQTIVKKLTEDDFYNWNRAKQIVELEKLGIKPGRKESDRVKQLMEAQ